MATTIKRASAAYDGSNRMAARVIVSNVARYGGEQAALVRWARAVLARQSATITGPLFAERRSA
jgi:hypothetical protein